MLEVVDAMPEDEPFLLAVYAGARQEEVSGWGWDALQLEAFLHMQYRFQQQSYRSRYPEAVVQLIVQDGRRIGKLLVAREHDAIVLVDIALLPEHRNRGYGSAFMQSLQREAEQCGKPIILHVQTANRAKELYERLGFQQVSLDSMYCEMKWVPASTHF
ncbi:N-acetyltransferase [Paenibacillus sp. H1-7]|uniref:GNAT family N-acetyltransferase n=1 Tax=Paenibacillus sp. H1-7 TaxID=2282849 RepID=UPI001EF9175B|nr:GNAT family N-acetyltransferase [Paenibacillus sp. H1-7]ULL19266.1 N-acetyltransferase [Paenibacillus sp. H1-7]